MGHGEERRTAVRKQRRVCFGIVGFVLNANHEIGRVVVIEISWVVIEVKDGRTRSPLLVNDWVSGGSFGSDSVRCFCRGGWNVLGGEE